MHACVWVLANRHTTRTDIVRPTHPQPHPPHPTRALLLLENACFACPDNEARLLEASVTSGEPPLVATAGLVAWLAQQLGLLARQALITGIKKVSVLVGGQWVGWCVGGQGLWLVGCGLQAQHLLRQPLLLV